MNKLLVMTALVVSALIAHPMASAIEEPTFQVSQTLPDGVEVRDYGPYIVAEVEVAGPAGDAGSQGFSILAGYIFGKNKGERKIEMTAPVMQTPAGQKIEMTAPVTQIATERGFLVQFVMPAGSTLDTLPEPKDTRIVFKSVPGARYAVLRYSGFWTESNYRTHVDALRTSLEAARIDTVGEPIYARYDPPWTPWFMRRNEIWLKLA